MDPHNTIHVWKETKAKNIPECMDNNLDFHQRNHKPKSIGVTNTCLQEQLLLMMDCGIESPMVLKACITMNFLCEGLPHEEHGQPKL